MINLNESAAKRLAIWKPMSKPYVDSRFHFTTELYRIVNILNTNKIVNSQVVKNNIDTKLRKVLLLLLLQQVIKNKKSVNKGQWQTNNNIFKNSIPKVQGFQNFGNKYSFKSEPQRNFQYLNNIYNSSMSLNQNGALHNLSNESEPTLYNGYAAAPQILSQSVGQSILNSTKNIPIPQIQYNDLPEFEPMNVQSENVPVYNFGTTNYSRIGSTDSYASGSNGFGIDIGQLLQAGSALYSLWKLNNKRKQTQTNKTQPQNNKPQPVEQGFEFIPE